MSKEFSEKVMATFSEKLRAAREAAGFEEAEDFANALGVRAHRYRHWEAGRAKPDIVMVSRICQLLEVEPNDLLPHAVKKRKKDTPALSTSSSSGEPEAA